MNPHDAIHWLAVAVVVAPGALLAVLGLTALFRRPVSEQTISRLTQVCVIVGLLSSIAILTLMLLTGRRNVPIEFGHWIALPEEQFHFHFKLVFDRLSVPFTILTFVLVGTIGGFANQYLHRERGYARFFLLYAVFLFGMVLAALAETIETLFLGWELVGLSSALLVGYFHERPNPVRNGQRVWAVYRVADAAFLIAAVALHHLTGEGDFSRLMGSGAWPDAEAALTSGQALAVGGLLLIAAAGKSGLIPFSGWLPRAMEGPTPSSAVFYGALSIHLGVYLLLRVSPIIALSSLLSGLVVLLGLATAALAGMSARVQTDVKSALAYASVTQVGIITAEIGLGLHYLALVHLIGHACLRTLQLLRAPSLLLDYHSLENAIGSRLRHGDAAWEQVSKSSWRHALYRLALHRGELDALLDRFVAAPFLEIFRSCDGLERRWRTLLSGEESALPETMNTAPGSEEAPR